MMVKNAMFIFPDVELVRWLNSRSAWVSDQDFSLIRVYTVQLYTRVHKILSWYDRILKYFRIREIQRKQKKNRTGLLNVGHQRETTIGQLPITIALLRICWFPRITLGTKLSDQYVVFLFAFLVWKSVLKICGSIFVRHLQWPSSFSLSEYQNLSPSSSTMTIVSAFLSNPCRSWMNVYDIF